MLGRPKLNRATRLKLKRGSRPKLNRSTRPILGARSGYMDFDALNPSKLENAYRFYCRLELCNKVCLTVSVFEFVYHLSSSISIVILPILKLVLAFI